MTKIYLVINPDYLKAFDLLDNAKTLVNKIIREEYSDCVFQMERMRHADNSLKRIDWIENEYDNVISIHVLDIEKRRNEK